MTTLTKIEDKSFFLVRWYVEFFRWREAKRALKADAIYARTPVFKHTVLGETSSGVMWRWDLYETPTGKRTVKAIKMSSYTMDQERHPQHYRIITPWLAKVISIDYEKSYKDANGSVHYWYNKKDD
jgi:hypothetical protein